jgi:hypothetical protein
LKTINRKRDQHKGERVARNENDGKDEEKRDIKRKGRKKVGKKR